MHRAVRMAMFAQLSLFFFLTVCFLLMPHFLLESNEGGVSNYGVHAKTIVPYTLAFGLCGGLTLLAVQDLPRDIPNRRMLQWVLSLAGTLYILVLISTYAYQLNNAFDTIHEYAGVALFLLEVIAAIWLVRMRVHDTLQILSFAVLLTGFTLSALTYFGYLHVLFIAEMLTNLGFGVLLVHTLGRVVAPEMIPSVESP
jgi:hypothetical protein